MTGVCFLATAETFNYIADVPLYSQLNTSLQIHHVAQHNLWDTQVHVANPNKEQATVTMFVNSNGEVLYTKQYQIAAMGSGKFDLSELVENTSYASGSVEIESSQGVVAFALYHNLKTGEVCYAGIAVMAP